MMDSLVLAYTATVAFLGGVAVGWLVAAQRQTWKGQMPTNTAKATKPRSDFSTRDRVLVALVLVALLVNGAVGFLQIENGRQDRARTECSIRFNERLGLALDERAARATASTMAELELWKGIRSELEDTGPGDDGPTGASAEIKAYVTELRAAQKSRIENPYPPADLCREDDR